MGYLYRKTSLFLGLLVAFCLSFSGQARAQDQEEAKKLEERIDALIKVLRHPEPRSTANNDYTIRAIEELGGIGIPAATKLIDAILGKQSEVSAFSAVALDRIGKPAVDIVREGWPKWTEEEKWKLMPFRGKHDYDMSRDFALASLESKSPVIRRQAIVYLGEHKESKARPIFLDMLNKEVPESHRWPVIEYLGSIGNDEVVDALIGLLAPDSWAAKGKGLMLPKDMESQMRLYEWLYDLRFEDKAPAWMFDGRQFVIATLGKMGARKAAPKLLEILQEKGDKQVNFGFIIIPLLGEWGYTESIPALKLIYTFDKEGLKGRIARSLLQLKDRTGIPLLTEWLQFTNYKQFACRTIANYGTNADVPILAKCLDDDNPEVLFLACQGLERITKVAIRAPGQKMTTLRDVPLWKKWYENNLNNYKDNK